MSRFNFRSINKSWAQFYNALMFEFKVKGKKKKKTVKRGPV